MRYQLYWSTNYNSGHHNQI